MSSRFRHRPLNQEGFAALVIAFIMILVLSLLTVGFAELMRREERSALDKQLGDQAYYAAEAGVNDAAKAINAGYLKDKPDCGPLDPGDKTPGANFLRQSDVGTQTSASYTCLTIDTQPPEYKTNPVSVDQSKIIQLTGKKQNSSDDANIATMTFNWQNSGGADSYVKDPGTLFKPVSDWTYTGVLRVTITPLVSSGISRDYLIANTYNGFFYPNDDSSSPVAQSSWASNIGDNSGVIVKGNCRSSGCSVVVSDLGQINYLVTLRAIYKPVQVSIKLNDADGNPLDVANAQTVVDSTGKAQDVLKRIQVRIPTHNNYPHPDFTLETMGSICKQLELLPGSSTNACDKL